jgi:hypothetical protein
MDRDCVADAELETSAEELTRAENEDVTDAETGVLKDTQDVVVRLDTSEGDGDDERDGDTEFVDVNEGLLDEDELREAFAEPVIGDGEDVVDADTVVDSVDETETVKELLDVLEIVSVALPVAVPQDDADAEDVSDLEPVPLGVATTVPLTENDDFGLELKLAVPEAVLVKN